MKGENIGELEELILLSVGVLYENAYALTILEEINQNTNRNMDVTAIHSVLRRLEKKGLVLSKMGGATNDRGGRRKRFFSLSHAGRTTLEHTMMMRKSFYERLPKLTFAST